MDYSFMKTGNSRTPSSFNQNQLENLHTILCLFTNNSIINAAKYVEFCGRDGVTQKDVEYGLKYEVFEFLNRGNLEKELEEMRNEIETFDENIKLKSQDNVDDVDLDKQDDDEEDDNLDELIVSDDEIDNFSRFLDENFSKLTESHDIVFIEKMHKHYDNWSSWDPETPLEKILKNAIDTKI